MKKYFIGFMVVVYSLLIVNTAYAGFYFGDCGNGIIDMFEACDGNDFGGLTCQTEGYSGGNLICSADCYSFSTSNCSNLEPGTVLRLDFNGFGPGGNGHTANGYSPVRYDQLKTSSNNYGWNVSPWYFERIEGNKLLNASTLERLQYDGQFAPYGESRTFTMDVTAGYAYQLVILTGDTMWNHDRQLFAVIDPNGSTQTSQLVSTISGTPDGATLKYLLNEQIITGGNGSAYGTVRLLTDIIEPVTSGSTKGIIQLTVQDKGGSDPSAVILGLDLRPINSIIPVTIEPINPAQGIRYADGISVDTYHVTGAMPNTLMTVTATNGLLPLTIASDNNVSWFGGQIMSDNNGEFNFTLTRPARDLPVTITVAEYMGSAYGTYVQEYKTGVRFDFGNYNSPVAQGFLAMYPQMTFNEKRGYGWVNRVASGDRKDPNIGALGTDQNNGGDGTFRMPLDPGDYKLRLTHCNAQYYGKISYASSAFSVLAEGINIYNIANIPAGTCVVKTATVPVLDGLLDLRLYNGQFIISGLEVFEDNLP